MNNEQYVEIDGIRTRYFEAGSGEPLLLIHGGAFGQTDNVDLANNWDLNWEGFSQSFRVYALDKLGQGFTDNPPSDSDYTIDAVLNHTLGFMREMGPEKASLVGHSRGGYLALRLALEHPELVKTLIIVDSSTASPHLDDAAGLRAVRSEQRVQLLANTPRPLRSRESIRWVTEQFSASPEHISEEWLDVRERVARQPKNEEAISAIERVEKTLFLPRLLAQKEETLKRVGQGELKIPTLLVWGYNDPTAILPRGLKLFDLVVQGASRSQMHIFNRAGHYAYREHPQDFVRVVSDFVRGS